MVRKRQHNIQLTKSDTAELCPAPAPASSTNKRSLYTRKAIWIIALVALLVAGFTATLFSAYSAEQMAGTKRVVTMEVRGAALDASATQQALEASALMENAPTFVIWKQRSQEYVENPELGRGVKVNVLLAQGNVDLIVKGAFLPEEEIPSSIDAADSSMSEAPASSTTTSKSTEQACIIDASTALALFGDTNVTGLSVRYGSEDFIVEAVVKSARPLFLIRPTAQTGVAFDMVTVSNVSAQSAAALGEQVALGFGLELEVLEYDLLYHLTRLLAWLPTLLLATGYLVFLLLQGFVKDSTSRYQAIFLSVFLLGLAALIAFISSNVYIPRDVIPSRFSDFALWQQIIDDKGAALSHLFDIPAYVPVAQLIDSFFAVVAFSIVSITLYLGAIWMLTQARFVAHAPRHVKKQDGMLTGRITPLRFSSPHHSRKKTMSSPPAQQLEAANHKVGKYDTA